MIVFFFFRNQTNGLSSLVNSPVHDTHLAPTIALIYYYVDYVMCKLYNSSYNYVDYVMCVNSINKAYCDSSITQVLYNAYN